MVVFVQLNNCVSSETTYGKEKVSAPEHSKPAVVSNCCYKLNMVNILIKSGP